MSIPPITQGVRVFEVVTSGIQVAVLGFVAWLSISTIDQGNRLTAIESNRYTSADALIAERGNAEATYDILIEIGQLRTDIAGKANTKDVPPPEILRWLERLEKRIDLIDAEIERRHQAEKP